jgi:alkylation response protein AidB-like acyl-CoA dehydrogenase
VPAPAVREIYEDLAGACGVTFFTWVQHHAPVRLLASSPSSGLQQRALPELRSGRQLAGIAFAYLRRTGPPAVAARRVEGGLVVDGEAPWVTSWGLADVFAVAARLEGDVVFFLLPGRATPAVRPSRPLALAAMNASSTVRLAFDGLFVPDDDVISVTPLEQWQRSDRIATAKPHPAVFGVIRTCCRLLGLPGKALDDERAECRALAYALADDPRTDDAHLARMVEARAWSYDIALRAAGALVASAGGGAMQRSHPAQRLLREAAFYSIQAQSAELRSATLDRLQGRSSRS